MKLSTRTRYGVRAMFELAQNYGKDPVHVKVIAEHQDVSIKYLEQLIATLKSAGFVRAVRGAKGGYILAKPPSQIKVSDCFNCLEGPVITVECVQDSGFCTRAVDCPTREVWCEVQEAVMNVLESMTLQDLINRRKARVSNYQI